MTDKTQGITEWLKSRKIYGYFYNDFLLFAEDIYDK